LPGYSRAVLRPRLSWTGDSGATFFATAGFTSEAREGGTLGERVLPPTGAPYIESLDTDRIDAGALAQTLIRNRFLVVGRFAAVRQRHTHRFGEVRERDRHETMFGELTVRGSRGRQTWVGGVALEREAYRPAELPQFRYTFTVPGIFVQDDVQVSRLVSVSASVRLDRHSEYGTFLSPRVSALVRAGAWNGRLSVGTGFFGPSPLTEETEAAGLSRLTIPRPLEAERGESASFDLSRTDGPASYTMTFFASRVRQPIHLEHTSTGLTLTNLEEPTLNTGIELLGTLRREPFALTGTYTYVRAREEVDAVRQDVTLTPRHSAGLVGMWEREDVGRVGVEWYYTGVQRVEQNPFRERTEPYMILGALAERQFGRFRFFINGENLTGVRQSEWNPLLRPSRASDGRWTVDAWAPLEGRNVNGGVRLAF
jgi:iron complex outermembrane receptor protein